MMMRKVHATFILLLLVPACGGTANLELSRKFQEAQRIFNDASTQEEFLQSATIYRQILDTGFTNGALLYNMGNAFMNADRRGHAIAAYRQADRYRPRDPFLDANLSNALGPDAPLERQRTLVQHLLFWQDWLSYPEKFHGLIFLAALSLILAFSGLYSRKKVLWRRLMALTLIVTLILAISACYDWYRYDWLQHGVISGEEVIARKGNSESYQPAFTEPLVEGKEFQVLEHRADWLLIRIRGGPEGWIPAKEAVVY